MKDFDEKSVKFIIRNKNRKFEEIESFLMEKISKWDDWEVMKDKSKVYTGKPVLNKREYSSSWKKSRNLFSD